MITGYRSFVAGNEDNGLQINIFLTERKLEVTVGNDNICTSYTLQGQELDDFITALIQSSNYNLMGIDWGKELK